VSPVAAAYKVQPMKDYHSVLSWAGYYGCSLFMEIRITVKVIVFHSITVSSLSWKCYASEAHSNWFRT